jgi:GSH-dependent disulfide-bond oxidoreductase
MLIYYDWNASPNCFKTKILLLELGLEYEQRDVGRPELQGRDFRREFPAGQAPALRDGDLRLAESSAIALYLAEKHERLIPRAPERRAAMYQALAFEASYLGPVVGGRGYFGEWLKPEPERDLARLQRLETEAQRVAEILDAMLGTRQYFAEEFSVADIQLYAGTTKAIEHRLFREPSARLVDWHRRVGSRPSVVAAREMYLAYRTPENERAP